MKFAHIQDMSDPRFLSSPLLVAVQRMMTPGTKAPPKPAARKKPRQARSQARVNRILDVAEKLLIAEGYNATTTQAIAAQAEVPIGSLYQFFPDKNAIVGALAERYNDQMYALFLQLHASEAKNLSLKDYVDRIVDSFDQFLKTHPGYLAILMPLQGLPELAEIDAENDDRLIQGYIDYFQDRYPGQTAETYEAIAFVIVKGIGTLLWFTFGQTDLAQTRLVQETKKLMLSYLLNYFEDSEILES